MPRPTLLWVNSTSISIAWNAPTNDGGCPITGYKVYVDDGAGGPFTEYDAADVENKPFLSTVDIDMSSQTVGLTYLIKVGALNVVNEVQSDTIPVTLASVPIAPAPPTSTYDGSNMTIFMTAPASNGGIQIISY
jgi:hypothetical protein